MEKNLIKQTCLILATAVIVSSLSINFVRAFATEDTETALTSSTVQAESPLLSKDYSETILADYVDVLTLTNASVSIDQKQRIQKAISIIEDSNDETFANEEIYLKSLLIQIENLEQITANEFFNAYSQYLNVEKVSDSDNDTIKLATLAEMLEVYYSYNESIQGKIHEMCPERLDRCIALYNAFCAEKNEFLAKHDEILKKSVDEITLDDFDKIIAAVADYSNQSKACQSMLIDEKKTLDNAMTKYLELKDAQEEKARKEKEEKTVSPSDIVLITSSTDVSASDLSKDTAVSGGQDNQDSQKPSENDNDIGYDVYDTGDVSFSSIALTSDIMCISFLTFILMFFLIHEYISFDVCLAAVNDCATTLKEKYNSLCDNANQIKKINFDEWSEDAYDRIRTKINNYIRSRERINYIEIIE